MNLKAIKRLKARLAKHKMDLPVKTDAPIFTVFINGLAMNSQFQLLSLNISKSINKISTAYLEISDGDVASQEFSASSSGSFNPGKKIEIFIGEGNSVFKGIIIKHAIKVNQNKSLLSIEVKDIAVKLTVGRKNRVFENKTDKEILEDVFSKSGVYEDSDHIVNDADLKHQEMVQYFCTDWDFILSRAEANGLLVFVEDGTIYVGKPDVIDDPKLFDSVLMTTITMGHGVHEFEAEMDAREEYKSVVASSWDSSKRSVLDENANSAPSIKKPGALVAAVNTASNILNGKDAVKQPLNLADVIGLESFALQHPGQIKKEELKAWAGSKALRSQLSKIKGRVKIEGNPFILPGDSIKIKKFADHFNGIAYVSAVNHSLSGNKSFTTEIHFGFQQDWFSQKYNNINDPLASGLLPAVHGLQPGIVKQITGDPQKDYRIKVSMPLLAKGNEGVWARLATLDAGKDRGSFFIPEVGDEVILGFMNDDPREPVILGLLYSSNSNGKPPLEPTDSNTKKGFYTKNKIKLEFDDEKKSILISAPDGNEILLEGGDKSAISIKDKSGNTVEMNDKGITINSSKDLILSAKGNIKLDGGTDITQAAKANLKLEGKASVELSSGANTVIKGTVVQIN
ncbi:MAG: type VI secretion system tip protein VgrG [Bacteroidia bacterium]|nr:type VI secretion system tip protein VgrG [Bacteroidia bacterium]